MTNQEFQAQVSASIAKDVAAARASADAAAAPKRKTYDCPVCGDHFTLASDVRHYVGATCSDYCENTLDIFMRHHKGLSLAQALEEVHGH